MAVNPQADEQCLLNKGMRVLTYYINQIDVINAYVLLVFMTFTKLTYCLFGAATLHCVHTQSCSNHKVAHIVHIPSMRRRNKNDILTYYISNE